MSEKKHYDRLLQRSLHCLRKSRSNCNIDESAVDVCQFERLTLRAGDLYHAETVGTFAAQQNDLRSIMRHYAPELSLLMRKGAINAGLAESPLRGLRRLFFVDVNDCGFVVYQSRHHYFATDRDCLAVAGGNAMEILRPWKPSGFSGPRQSKAAVYFRAVYVFDGLSRDSENRHYP